MTTNEGDPSSAGRDTSLLCPVCGAEGSLHVMSLKGVPLFCNVLLPSREEALKAERGDIDLSYCPSCGHYFNASFDSSRMDYTAGYEASLHYSPHFQEYAVSLAERLFERYRLRDRTVADIGCGGGDFLALFCDLGVSRGLGFDPGFGGKQSVIREGRDVSILAEAFDSTRLDDDTGLIFCRHVLEHLDDPVSFIADVRRALGPGDAVAYFEVPNAGFVLHDYSIWDIIYEHCHYFTTSSLSTLFLNHGFEVVDLEEAYHGQYLGLVARSAEPGIQRPIRRMEDVTEWAGEPSADFLSGFEGRRSSCEQLLMKGQDRCAVLWGAGSKGVSLLNGLAGSSLVDHVVDVNPRKQGLYIPGTGHRVDAPEALHRIKPDIVWLPNPVYLQEVRSLLQQMDLQPEVVSLR